MRKLIYGVGERDDGGFTTSINGKTSRVHSIWNHMLQRCYCPISLAKRPGYAGCIVDIRFLKFQEFATWATSQPGFHKGWSIDKDIMQKGNKIYGPDHCVFVPSEINSLFIRLSARRGEFPIGVYKRRYSYGSVISISNKRKHLGSYSTPIEAFNAYKSAKEVHIKEVADKWKGQLDPRVYAAMMAYNVEITD